MVSEKRRRSAVHLVSDLILYYILSGKEKENKMRDSGRTDPIYETLYTVCATEK